MSKGNTPRFTRRVRKDIPAIKARFQKKPSSARNTAMKERLRWDNKIKKHIILTDFNLFLC